MAQNREAILHLKRSREALLKQQESIAASVAKIDEVIATLTEEESPLTAAPLGRFTPRVETLDATITTNRPSVRQSILKLLTDEPRVWRVTDMLPRLEAMGATVNDASVRSVLTKMSAKGEVENVDRGLYRLPRNDDGPTEEVEPSFFAS